MIIGERDSEAQCSSSLKITTLISEDIVLVIKFCNIKMVLYKIKIQEYKIATSVLLSVV